MRASKTVLFVLAAIGVAACVHDQGRPVVQPAPPEPASSPPPSRPSQYLIADPSPTRGAVVALPLGAAGVHGVLFDKRRVVFGEGEPRVAAEATSDPIVGASKIPGRFGGGFLFWTANTLYRSDAFDAKLVPLARVPEPIEAISFAPNALLARTRNGERWALTLPGGERARALPLGAADVQALDDGRALGFDDRGAVFTSLDGGEHWTDATAQVRSSPLKVATAAGELWLHDSYGGAYRLERDGRLSWFDSPPPEPLPELRARDPRRWRGSDAPLRAAFRSGAAFDDATALVVESGDLLRIDLRTGEVVSVVAGRLPPDAQCEAVPASGDVLFACVSRAAGVTSFVVSHTLSSERPVIELTLPGGAPFFASDDGGLAYGASCRGFASQPAGVPAVCVRMPGGRWEEHDVSALAASAGDVTVARWVPRADGRVVAIVVDPGPGIYDPSTGTLQPIPEEVRDIVGRAGLAIYGVHGKLRYKHGGLLAAGSVVDTAWSFAEGNALRGWQRYGESVELSEDGRLTRSPFAFEVVFAGPMGLGRSQEGRLYQSADHGSTWVEVATPPSGAEALELVSCTSAGCDLGTFYRVGWAPRPARVEEPASLAPAAPEVRRVRGLELSCRPSGPVVSKAIARTIDSPEDLGLGTSRLPVATERADWSYVRNPVPRAIVSPVREPLVGDSDILPSLRAVFSGFGTARDGDVITVAGPNRSAMALRRGVSFVAPFDPSARIVRSAIAMSDVVAAGRRAGMATDEILAEDATEAGAVVALTSPDPSAPSDIAIHNADRGLVSIFRGDRASVVFRASQESASIVSGVILSTSRATPAEAAFLEVEPSGVGRVFKVSAGGVSDLFDVSPAANEAVYPANPDALAIGEGGDLAILRTPSGTEPPSSLDPAFLVAPGKEPSALAPWSELAFADDPQCKAEPGGYRAVVQALAPWIGVTTPELRVERSPMLARVRWTTKRVCLEGFEVKLPGAAMHVPGTTAGETRTFATWLVGKGSSFARVAVAEGIEWRQTLECSVVSTTGR